MFFLISIPLVYADLIVEKTNEGLWVIKAKPRICVTPAVKPQCMMQTDIIWSGSLNADICLLSSQTQESVHCWVNAQTGHVLEKIMSEHSVTYWLSHRGEKAILAKTTLHIVIIPQRQIRRRRRHIWSLL